MIATSRKPVSPGEMLVEEFLAPLKLTRTALANRMGVEQRLVNEICVGKRAVTADTALMLATVFCNTPDFWLNTQRRSDMWAARHDRRRSFQI